MKEGYIKFNCQWKKTKLLSPEWKEIEIWRKKLFDLGLIGAYPNGIGFGNISLRLDNENFLITGSQTGHLKNLDNRHYTEVIDFDLENNNITCQGPIKASSESLSHAAIYKSSNEIKAVIHIHNLKLWQQLLNKLPTTDKNAAYGTLEMAKELQKLVLESKQKVLIMGGHREGIIAFGANLDEAGNNLLQLLNN